MPKSLGKFLTIKKREEIIISALSTMRKLMATSSMSRLNQKIITIVSFLNDYETLIFSAGHSWKNVELNEKFLLIKEKLRRINGIKRRAG